MDKLPQEILDNIAGPHFRPSSVSAISRRLRTAVESLTFQKLSLQHLPTDREQARWRALIEALRSEPNHIRALNVLAFEINLQHYKFPYLRGAPDQLPLQRQQNQVVSEAEVEFQRVRSPHYLLEQTFGLLRSLPDNICDKDFELRFEEAIGDHQGTGYWDILHFFGRPHLDGPGPLMIPETNRAFHALAARMAPVPSIKKILLAISWHTAAKA